MVNPRRLKEIWKAERNTGYNYLESKYSPINYKITPFKSNNIIGIYKINKEEEKVEFIPKSSELEEKAKE